MIKLPTDRFIEYFKKTPGAISVCESIAISWLASQSAKGTCIDLGTNAGKAAMSTAQGLAESGINNHLHMVDPIFDLTNREAFAHSVQGSPENVPWAYVNDPMFNEKVDDRIRICGNFKIMPFLHGDYSENFLRNSNAIGWCFVDSDDHDDKMIMEEVRLLEDRVVEGGIIAFHDYKNQFVATEKGYNWLIATGKYQPIEIQWEEITAYVKENDLEKGNDSWHMPGVDFPCFVGAVKRI